jgi:hypothetical protein
MRASWVKFLRGQLIDHDAHNDGATFQPKAPNRGEVVRWTRSSWDELSPNVIKSGFSMAIEPAIVERNDLVEQLSIHDAIGGSVADTEDEVDRTQGDTRDETAVNTRQKRSLVVHYHDHFVHRGRTCIDICRIGIVQYRV